MNTVKIRKKIIMNSIISVLVVSILFSIYFIASFYKHFTSDMTEKNKLVLDDVSSEVELIINTYINIAKQIESRSVIKESLDSYDKGLILIKDLKDFTTPKLMDATAKIIGIKGIIRLTSKNEIVTSIGQVEEFYINDLIKDRAEVITIRLYKKNSSSYFIINSKILNKEKEFLGRDILIFTVDEIKKSINKYSYLINISNENGSSFANDSFSLLNNGINLEDYINIHSYISAISSDLNIYIDKDVYHKPLFMEFLKIIPILLCIGLIGIFNGYSATLPLAGKIIMQHEELEEEIEKKNKELVIANSKLRQLSNIDGLSGLYNRRYFDNIFFKEWERLTSLKKTLSLIMCDIDFFKLYNEAYGHKEGDKCIQIISDSIIHHRRITDIAARYGGEEFIILLPKCDLKTAEKIAENIKDDISNKKIPHESSNIKDKISLSFGVATAIPNKDLYHLELLEAAEQALYLSKYRGRDQISTIQL